MIYKALIWLLVTGFIYLCEKKKGKHILSQILMVTLVVFMMGGNNENADWFNYQIRYNESASGNFLINAQWAQALFGYLCNRMGLSYEGYRLVYYTVGVLLLYRVFKKYTKSIYLPFIFYIIDPMIIDATQSKNFMMMAIAFNAMPYLGDRKIKSKIKFILLIFLAAGFHITAYAYLPLLLFCDIGIKKRYRALAVAPIILFDIVFARQNTIRVFYNALIGDLQAETSVRMANYGLKQVHYGYLVYWLATILMIATLRHIRKMLTTVNIDAKKRQMVEITYLCDLYALAFFPLNLLTIDFSRLFRNFAVMNHLAVSNALQNDAVSSGKFKVSKGRMLLATFYIAYLFYVFYFDIAGYRDTVLIPFMEKNWLL